MTEHQGLPVAGYRAQPSEAVETVNAMKIAEEQVLRLLDDLAEDELLAADKRFLAIGRTHIELGFMAVNRSVFKPERVSIPEEDDPVVESGWVIEDASSEPAAPCYFSAGANGPSFVADHNCALRFARREDAEAFVLMSSGNLTGVRIAEHQWS